MNWLYHCHRLEKTLPENIFCLFYKFCNCTNIHTQIFATAWTISLSVNLARLASFVNIITIGRRVIVQYSKVLSDFWWTFPLWGLLRQSSVSHWDVSTTDYKGSQKFQWNITGARPVVLGEAERHCFPRKLNKVA